MKAELDDAVYAAVAAVAALTVEALAHFDEVIVVVTNCSRYWDDLQETCWFG